LIITNDEGPSSAEEWDRAVYSSRDAWLYHLSDVARVDFWTQWSAPLFIECQSNGRVIGGALLSYTDVWKKRLLPLKRQIAQSFVGNLIAAPFVIDGLAKSLTERVRHLLFEELMQQARALGCVELWLGDTPQSQATLNRTNSINRYILSDAWQNHQRHHFFVDLRTDEAERWANLDGRLRTSIRRAGAAGVTVLTGAELTDAEDQFVTLMSGLDEIRALTPEKLRSIWAALYADARHGQAFFALEDGTPRSFVGVTLMGRVASYHLGARSTAASSGATPVALWEGIRWAAAAGCEWFDVGKVVPNIDGPEQYRKEHAISRFKESFGGQIIPVDLACRPDLLLGRARALNLADIVARETRRRLRRASRQVSNPNRF